MKYYLAPLEGITGYIFRNAVSRYFGNGVAKYFTPFFPPSKKRHAGSKEMRDALPENNTGLYLVPQILTVNAEDFLSFERDMGEYGYHELNINLGCPSDTVAAKGRGAAFLADPEKLERFLDDVFEKTTAAVSVKTRLGVDNPEEFYEILAVYNKYPMHELIIHPRVRAQQYRGNVEMDLYRYAEAHAKMPLCYNGDICAPEDVPAFAENTRALMCGRGMVQNPSLIRMLSGKEKYAPAELSAFLAYLLEEYEKAFSGDVPLLYKLKEIWVYLQAEFPGKEKALKKIMKSKSRRQYEDAVAEMFR